MRKTGSVVGVAGRTIAVGNIVGQVSFTSNDANQATFNFAVTGTAATLKTVDHGT